MECWFEFSVEGERMSSNMYETPQDARVAANERYKELCDQGDYSFDDYGDAFIYCIDGETEQPIMSESYAVSAEEDGDIADGRDEVRS